MPLPRRSFLTLPALLVLPWQPERVYSFLPAWRLLGRNFFESYIREIATLRVNDARVRVAHAMHPRYGAENSPPGELWVRNENLLDVLKSADAYGYARPVVL